MALTGCHVSVVTQQWIFGEICFYSLYFFGHFFPILKSEHAPDMQNEDLFNIFFKYYNIGVGPSLGYFIFLYYVQFTINGILRNFTILVKLRRCELAL
jgi:hypothetical protein